MGVDAAALNFVANLDDNATAAANDLRQTMNRLGGPVAPITSTVDMQADGLSRTLSQVEGTNDDIVQDSEQSGDQAGRGLGESMSSAFEKSSHGMEKVAGVAGLAIAGAIVGSVAGAMDLEDANAKLTAQLGLNEPEAAKLGKAAGDVYANNWGESMDAVNEAVAAVYSSIDGMADASGATLEDATTKAIAFADTFDTDVTRAVQVVGQAVRTGLVKDADEGFDLLTKASQEVPANVREDLLDALDEYGPFFKSLGISGQDAFGMLVKGADKGMYGIDKTGDALKEFGIRATDMSTATQAALGAIDGIDVTTLDKNSKEGKAALAAIGQSSQDLSNDLLGGGKTAKKAFEQTVEGLLAIKDPATQANAAIALFGTPLEDLSVQEIPGFLKGLTGGKDAMGDFTGAADKMTDTVGGTTSGAFQAIKRDLEQTAAAWGAKLLPIVKEFLPQIKALAPIILGLVAAFVVLNGILKAVAITQALLNSTLLANPITWVVIAIAALVAGLVIFFTKTELGRKIITSVWGAIKTAIGAVVRWWTNTAMPAMRKAFDVIVTVVKAVASGIRTYVGIWRTIITAVVTAIATVIRTYVNIWKAIISTAVRAIAATFEWFASLPGKIAGWFTAVVTKIRGTVSKVKDAVGDIVQAVKDKLTGAIEAVKTIGGNIVQGVVDGITGSVHKVVDAAKSIVDNITGPVKKLLGIHSPSKVFEGYGVNTVEGFIRGLDKTRDKASSAVGRLVAKIRDTKGLDARESELVRYAKEQGRELDAAWKLADKAATKLGLANDKLKAMKADRAAMKASVASSIMGTVDIGSVIAKDAEGNTRKGKTTFAAVSGYVKGMVAKFKTFAHKLGDLRRAGLPATLVQYIAGLGPDDGTEVAKAMLSGSSGQIKQLKQDWSALNNWSKSAGNAVAAVTYDTGIAAQAGLVKGLTKDTKKAEKAARSLARQLARWIRDELGIHSPSRVFQDIGDQTVAGLALGLEDDKPVRVAMQGLTDTMTANINPTPIGLSGATSQTVRVQIDHVVTSPDGSVRNYTAQQLADMLARDPAAAATIEGATRKAVQVRTSRTLSASTN